jgi:hypothetical protein
MSVITFSAIPPRLGAGRCSYLDPGLPWSLRLLREPLELCRAIMAESIYNVDYAHASDSNSRNVVLTTIY